MAAAHAPTAPTAPSAAAPPARGTPAARVRAGPAGAAELSVLDDPVERDRCTRWIGPAPSVAPGDDVGTARGAWLGESTLQLGGLHCAACAGLIEQALARVDGVLQARVSAGSQRATVQWDPARTRLSALVQAVRAAGYEAVPDIAAPARALRRREHRAALWRLFVAGFCAMQVMMFAAPVYLARPGEMAPALRQLLDWGSWVLTLPVLLFAAGPFFDGALRALRRGRIGMDLPVAIAIAVTFVASTGATFDPGGPFGSAVYFDSLTMFVAFLLGGRYVELRARHRAAESLEAALARAPETAQRLDPDGQARWVSVHRLQPGDLVRVGLGQAFAADGPLLEGRSAADESLLTGESLPVPKQVGDVVVAGSLNVGAPVLMRVQRAGADTRHAAIVAMMRDALTQRPAAARVADRWAGPFLGAVLLLAAATAAYWSGVDPSRALAAAVAVLIVTCPCALSLAAPAALVAAVGALARRGVLVQRLDAVEALARTRHLFIDKTGTLTEDRPVWRDTVWTPGRASAPHRAACEAAAASLAAWSQHPLARALAAGLPPSAQAWQAIEERAGQGLRGIDTDGVEWRLGSAAWTGARPSDDVQVWLARGARVLAGYRFDETVREGAAAAVAALRHAGLRLTLLSGDAPARAERLAQRLGIAEVVAGATPEAKLAALAAAQRAGEPVGMVGDGVNDAPVLARADVSLAMGQGALVARAHADAVIVSNRPLDLVRARATACKAMRIVRQNLAWAALYNLLAIPLALTGALPPWAAGLGMAASSMAVVLNALRAGR
ncbi:MAG: cadmium-translocating P-type ATPase [Burkholderiales bacterium]|nr:cadmium-translocating P-type ATPase [Burkholderiales bacterium]